MTKQDYFARGVMDATQGNTQHRRAVFMLGTWQAMAYKAGFDSVAGTFNI